MKKLLLISLSLLISAGVLAQTVLKGGDGAVSFVSEAPLELIKASSEKLEGVLILETGKFAFQVDMNSFEGFNNPLQRIHFQENYLESGKYPKAIFKGRILDEFLPNQSGTYSVRSKGEFTIHGVTKERIIRADLIVTDDGMVISCAFSIPLEDHDIRVPKIVYQKIASEIDVLLRIKLQ